MVLFVWLIDFISFAMNIHKINVTDLLLYCLTITFCKQVLAVVNIHAFIVCQWFSHVYFNYHLATFIQYINWLNDWNKKTNERKFQFYFKQNLQNMNKYRQNTMISNKNYYILIHSRMCKKRKVFIFKILQNNKSQ